MRLQMQLVSVTVFSRGICAKGDQCRYSHGSQGTSRTVPYKKEHCGPWIMGTCPHGSSCTFIHEPRIQGALQHAVDGSDCMFWLRGYCVKGKQCSLKHDAHKMGLMKEFLASDILSLDESSTDLPQTNTQRANALLDPNVLATTSSSYKIEHCGYWLLGTCSRGTSCTFFHEPEKKGALAHVADESDCIFWLQGKCYKGEECDLKHDVAKKGVIAKFRQEHITFSKEASSDLFQTQRANYLCDENALLASSSLYDTSSSTCWPEHCGYWLMGTCSRGTSCTFIHEPEKKGALAHVADESDCIFWLQGKCFKGEECDLKHDVAKKVVIARFRQEHKCKSNMDCVYWLGGKCIRGKLCLFRHEPVLRGSAPQSKSKIYGSKDRSCADFGLALLLSQKDDPEVFDTLLQEQNLVQKNVDTGLWEFDHEALLWKDRTILMLAARFGCYRIVDRILAAYKCSIDHQDEDDSTALMHAAWFSHTDTVTSLVRHGAKSDLTNKNQHTALDCAQNAQTSWQKSPVYSLKRNSSIFAHEILAGARYQTIDFRSRVDSLWEADWSKIIALLYQPNTDQSRGVYWKMMSCDSIEEVCRVVNYHFDAFSNENFVVAWQCLLEWTRTNIRTNTKTVLCRSFQNSGECARGKDCTFAHGLGELQAQEGEVAVSSENHETGEDQFENVLLQQTLIALEDATVNNIGNFDSKHVARIANTFAKWKYRPTPGDDLFQALTSRTDNLMQSATRTTITQILWAFAQSGKDLRSDLFEKIVRRMEEILLCDQFGIEQVINILESCAKLKRSPGDKVLNMFEEELEKIKKVSLDPWAVTAVLWAFASLQRHPRMSIVDMLLARADSISIDFSKKQIEDIGWACQELGLRIPEKLCLIASQQETQVLH